MKDIHTSQSYAEYCNLNKDAIFNNLLFAKLNLIVINLNDEQLKEHLKNHNIIFKIFKQNTSRKCIAYCNKCNYNLFILNKDSIFVYYYYLNFKEFIKNNLFCNDIILKNIII